MPVTTPHRRWWQLLQRLVAASLGVTTLAALPACTTAHDHPTPATSATTSASAPTSEVRWHGFSADCPTLTGDAARSLNFTGKGVAGQPMSESVEYEIDCLWQPGPDRPNLAIVATFKLRQMNSSSPVQVAHQTYLNDRAEADKNVSRNRDRYLPPQTLTGIGDEAFVQLGPGDETVHLDLRLANVCIGVNYQPKRVNEQNLGAASEELKQLQPTVQALVPDLLDDLR